MAAQNFLHSLVGSMSQGAAGNPTVAMIEAAFRHHGLHWRYVNMEVAPADLADAVRGARAMGFRGFNLSMPHKVTVIPHLDGLGESARLIGAVNCVVAREGRLVGENTDGRGFLESLRATIDPRGREIVLFGAGGAARAVAVELASILASAGVRLAVVQDQEQVDKFISINDDLGSLERILYDEKRGLEDYDHSRLMEIDALIEDARADFARDPSLRAAVEVEIDRGKAGDISIMLYTSGTTGVSKGVMLSAGGCVSAARDTVAFDKLNDRDEELAYLPLAWVGDHYMNYAQAFGNRGVPAPGRAFIFSVGFTI